MDLEAIHNALADQIRDGIDNQFNVAAFPSSAVPEPRIEVWPAPEQYIDYFTTFGPDGDADLMVEVRIDVKRPNGASVFKQMARLLSVGTGRGASIPDAINADPTLGGVVAHAKVLTARWDVEEDTAVVPVRIIVIKSGAES